MNQVLHELFGEVIQNRPWTRQPPIARAGVVAGLELFDLLLHPDHVVRATEELTFVDSLVLRRACRVDIDLDRISTQRERGASQLSALLWERPPSGDRHRTRGRLWTSLLYIPRPVATPVDVHEVGGDIQPRPPQREIRAVLEAALYHLLRESLRGQIEFKDPTSPVSQLLRRDDLARWTLQAAILAVCESGIGSPHSDQRRHDVLAATGRDHLADVSHDDLARLVHDERDPHVQLALRVLHEEVAAMPAFLDLVETVYRSYFVVAGLDPSHRDQSLRFDLPDAHALPTSEVRSFGRRTRRMLDVREHNFTARIHLPVPAGIGQYRLHISGSLDAAAKPETAISVMAAATFDPPPAKRALDILTYCQALLDRELAAWRDSAEGGTAPIRVHTIRFAVAHARAALRTIERITAQQLSGADDLQARWAQVDTRASVWQLDRFRARIERLNEVTTVAAHHVGGLAESPTAVADGGAVDAAAAALARVVAVMDDVDDRDLDLHLASEDLPGRDAGRIRVNRPFLAGAPESEVTAVDVWATLSDEARHYAAGVLVPPLGLLAMVWIFGAFLLRSATWPFTYPIGAGFADQVLGRQADALVAVLLLIPGISLAQIDQPTATSVRGSLRRIARWEVYTAVIVLSISAIVVATSTGVESGTRSDLRLVVWTLRGAASVFVVWLVWSLAAWRLRGRYVWRPKGVSRLLGRGRRGPRLVRYLRYDHKGVDAEFDLADPGRALPAGLGRDADG